MARSDRRYSKTGTAQRNTFAPSLADEDRTCAALAQASLSGQPEVDGGRFDADVRRLLCDSCIPDVSAKWSPNLFSRDRGGSGRRAICICFMETKPTFQEVRTEFAGGA